jgi:hypothetical protein
MLSDSKDYLLKVLFLILSIISGKIKKSDNDPWSLVLINEQCITDTQHSSSSKMLESECKTN